MPIQIAAFPATQASVQQVTLGTVRVGIGLTFNRNTRGWYMDLFAADGRPLFQGRRLSPSFSPNFGLAFDPADFTGSFTVQGQDGYTQGALGNQLTLWWWSPAELTALAEANAAANPQPALNVEIIRCPAPPSRPGPSST